MAVVHPFYNRRFWRDQLRPFILRRDPLCTICDRAASTVADHKIPHRGDWELFKDDANLAGVCKPCHDRKTAEKDGGFGHTPKPDSNLPHIARTGEPGKQFQSSSISDAHLDAALGNVDDLLEGL
jgi:hypothetical protein